MRLITGVIFEEHEILKSDINAHRKIPANDFEIEYINLSIRE